MTDDGLAELRDTPAQRARSAPSPHAMRASYERESGKPWVDGDPFCTAFERMWLDSRTSAYAHAPVEAAALADAVEADYQDPIVN